MKRIEFRPYPFFGLVQISYDKAGWWITHEQGIRNYVHFGFTTAELRKTKRWAFFLWRFQVNFWNLKDDN